MKTVWVGWTDFLRKGRQFSKMSELWQLEDELKVSEGLHQRNDLQSGLVCIVQHPQNLKQGALL